MIGINIARELKNQYTDCKVCLIEKENICGAHASGRNSGVLHAGFYYTADSLKAKYTQMGNIILTEYCESKGLSINKCGKLVVARNDQEDLLLDELLLRGKNNGVPLTEVSEQEAREIEPRVKVLNRAIYSPSTASVNPVEVMSSMRNDAEEEGIEIITGAQYLGRKPGLVKTSVGNIKAKYVVNAAGLYADKIAQDYGFSVNYRILPFKGLYLYSNEPKGSIKTNIYPVPDLRNPFLGVHFTLTVDSGAKVGPTAIPVLWREHYKGLDNFRIAEFLEIISRQSGLFLFSKFDFKRLAIEEIMKHSKRRMVQLASSLMEGITIDNYKQWGKPGIRAQLLDIKNGKLEMDFVIEGDNQSMHVLNAVSPAFTCSVPFARHVCSEINNKIGN